MISKEDAKQKYANIINSDPLAVTIINELIEEYEQALCINCKFDLSGCSVQDSLFHFTPNASLADFGCNKFQCK